MADLSRDKISFLGLKSSYLADKFVLKVAIFVYLIKNLTMALQNSKETPVRNVASFLLEIGIYYDQY